jgi:hypothetical protein
LSTRAVVLDKKGANDVVGVDRFENGVGSDESRLVIA